MKDENILGKFSPFRRCSRLGIPMWQCPQFLFITLGAVIIVTIVVTNILARHLVEPEFLALIILLMTAILFLISYFVVSSFERVAEASIAKSDFVSIMSHRIRTPLSVVRWRIDALRERHGPISVNEAKLAIGDVYRQNEKLVMLVNDLLDVSRIEDRALRLTPSEFRIRDVITSVLEIEENIIAAKDVVVDVNSGARVSHVYADEAKIKNVVFHLIDNAIRYSSRGGRIAISIGGLNKAKVRVTVNDEGIGISKKDLSHMFTKFYRAKGEYYYQTEGTGIGLYISKNIIEQSGGTIGVESVEGLGSTFWFTLPSVSTDHRSEEGGGK